MTRPFRLLITGSRTWGQDNDRERMYKALQRISEAVGYRNPVLVHGAAKGADMMADTYWRGLGHPVESHPWNDDWAEFGRAGGMRRNNYMVSLGANLCLAFIRDNSSGASQCARQAELARIPVVRFRS